MIKMIYVCYRQTNVVSDVDPVESSVSGQLTPPLLFSLSASRAHLQAKDAIFLQSGLSEPLRALKGISACTHSPPPAVLCRPYTDFYLSFFLSLKVSRPSRWRKRLLFNQEGIIFLIKYTRKESLVLFPATPNWSLFNLPCHRGFETNINRRKHFIGLIISAPKNLLSSCVFPDICCIIIYC